MLRRQLFYVTLLCGPLTPLYSDTAKIVIEAPRAKQQIVGTQVRISVKVDPGIVSHRLQAVVMAMDEPVFETRRTGDTKQQWMPTVSLVKGTNTIKVTDLDDSTNQAEVDVEANSVSDDRENFSASAYIGSSIDSFTSNEFKQYSGYTKSDTGPKLGYTAGIDFAYRFFNHNPDSRRPLQLWVYGETIHGQRTSEVTCPSGSQQQGGQASQQQGGQASQAPAVCAGINPSNFQNYFFAVLDNASSLEAYSGLRLEFFKFNPGARNSANLFVNSQLGFITVANNGAGVVDSHTKIGLGAVMTSGVFSGSYLQTGWGRSDLFAIHRGRRFKVDGYVQWHANIAGFDFYPFFQLTVDSDFGPGSDDIRSFYGINVEVRQLTCHFSNEGCATTNGKAAPGAH